jgi:hypothetical protein
MGHSIAGLVARKEVLRKGMRHLRHAAIASLEQGFGFLPAIDDLDDERAAARCRTRSSGG